MKHSIITFFFVCEYCPIVLFIVLMADSVSDLDDTAADLALLKSLFPGPLMDAFFLSQQFPFLPLNYPLNNDCPKFYDIRTHCR